MPQPNTIRLAGQVFPLDADGYPVLPALAGGATNTTTLAEDRASRLRASAATGLTRIRFAQGAGWAALHGRPPESRPNVRETPRKRLAPMTCCLGG